MNRMYAKPVILADDEISEGVYTASGTDCYTVTTNIHQRPETGRGDYRIQVNAAHSATHHSTAQVLVISFNLPVTYVSSNGSLQSSDGTSTLSVAYNYHNNGSDNIGLGDLIVTADEGLSVTGAYMTCNMTCSQHDGL
ncbi:MAG: hypothetical protein LUI39_11280 [Lachnospiraceae bacterium]|nr:hypothetical protein [Lachnospiraceae bacterium]